MIINLVGLLDDGTPLAEGLAPRNPRTAITLPFGGSVTIRFTAKTPMGADVPLVAPNVLKLTVKKRPADSKIFDRTATIVNGVAEFDITPADMKQQDPGYFVYDIWHTDVANKTNPVMPLSPLYLEAASRAAP